MMTGENGIPQIVGEWFAAINAHDSTRLAETLDDEVVWEIGEAKIAGRAAVILAWEQLWSGLPDLRLEVKHLLVNGEFAAARWRLSGTHRGELRFFAISPSGREDQLRSFLPTDRRVSVRGCTAVQVGGGKIVHAWGYWDTLSLLRQLGIVS